MARAWDNFVDAVPTPRDTPCSEDLGAEQHI